MNNNHFEELEPEVTDFEMTLADCWPEEPHQYPVNWLTCHANLRGVWLAYLHANACDELLDEIEFLMDIAIERGGMSAAEFMAA